MRAHDCGKMPFMDLLSKLKTLNVKNIQLALTKAVSDYDFSVDGGVFSPGLARFLRTGLSEHDIHISVLGAYINPVCQDEDVIRKEKDFFIEMLKYACFLKADMVGTETGNFIDANNPDANYEIFSKSMRELIDVAEKLGMFIGVEGVCTHTLYNPDKMKYFLDDMDSYNLCVIFDGVNLLSNDNYKEQGKIIDRAFELYGKRIYAIHIKDFLVDNSGFKLVPIGTGMFDFERLFYHLKNKPYIHMLIEGSCPERYASEKEFLKIKKTMV